MLKVCVNSVKKLRLELLRDDLTLTLVIVTVTQHLEETILVADIFELGMSGTERKG